ncbi:MAG: ABC transporter ATP-binding protein [Bacteroidetes bacterium]|nr:ABC transporter ATP-binding protein [Bacteroidota bacterium]
MHSHIEQNNEVIIRAVDLSKQFGNLTAVDKISFDIHQGEIFGLLGPNGAGKTTTIRMLCGLLPPSSGEIYFNDIKINSKHEIASKIGICPQENIHWDKLTCREQLIFIGSMYDLDSKMLKQKSEELLEMLGLSDKSSVRAARLSGGMKRRLNIALALIHDPEIIVLDEPEAGLDPQSRVLVRNFITSLSGEKTIILTTHNMDEADRLSDRIGIIDNGSLLLIDTPEKLKQTVGQGDILEIELEDPESTNKAKLIHGLTNCCDEVNTINHTLMIRSKDLMSKVPVISKKLDEFELKAKGMTIRQNTLEDVFIHLTGRKLRQ